MAKISINWVRDPRFEARCKELGVAWEYKEGIKVSDVDVKASLDNNARLNMCNNEKHQQLDDENTLSCSIDMANGMPIDAITLRKLPNKALMMVIGGNHRIAGLALIDVTTFTGYIVKCTDEQYDLLTRVDNRRGKGQGNEEAIEHCVHAHITYDRALTDLAKKWGLNGQQLQKVVRNRKLLHYLEDQRIPCEKITSAVLDALNPLKDQKAILDRAAHIISMYLPASNLVASMVDVVQKKNSEKQKMDYLERWERQLQNAAPPPGKRKPRTPLKTKLFKLMDAETGLVHLLGRCGKSGKNGDKSITNINELEFDAVDADRLIFLSKQIQEYLKPLVVQCQDLIRQVDPANKKKRR